MVFPARIVFGFQINVVNHVIYLLTERCTAISYETYHFLIGESSQQNTTNTYFIVSLRGF